MAGEVNPCHFTTGLKQMQIRDDFAAADAGPRRKEQ
jgi:hypothetical protein